MRLTVIDEIGFKTKDGKRIVAGLNIQQIEIPDEVLAEIKNKFELWLKKRGEDNGKS